MIVASQMFALYAQGLVFVVTIGLLVFMFYDMFVHGDLFDRAIAVLLGLPVPVMLLLVVVYWPRS